MELGESVSTPRCSAQVYDLVNCGPRNRFVVRSGVGHAPFLVHNCVQAISRDILTGHMMALESEGIHTVFHAHDELIIETEEFLAEATLERVNEVMATPPEWAPGLPLAVEAEVTDRYGK